MHTHIHPQRWMAVLFVGTSLVSHTLSAKVLLLRVANPPSEGQTGCDVCRFWFIRNSPSQSQQDPGNLSEKSHAASWQRRAVLIFRHFCVFVCVSPFVFLYFIGDDDHKWTSLVNVAKLRFVTRFMWLQKYLKRQSVITTGCARYICVRNSVRSIGSTSQTSHHVSDEKIYFLLSWNGWECGACRAAASSSMRIAVAEQTHALQLFFGRLSLDCRRFVSFGWSCASAAGQILIRNTWQIF